MVGFDDSFHDWFVSRTQSFVSLNRRYAMLATVILLHNMTTFNVTTFNFSDDWLWYREFIVLFEWVSVFSRVIFQVDPPARAGRKNLPILPPFPYFY